MTMMLDGKVALVTGAGRGIGREIALQLAEQGARVVVNDVGANADGTGASEGPAEEVVSAIRAKGGEAMTHLGSVASHADAQDMVHKALEAFGRLDILVNNAGILRDRMLHKMSEEDWDAVIAVHLKGCFNTLRCAAPVFREQGGGSVINFTSTSGLIGNLGQTNYSAAKMGIVGLTRNAALDLKRFNVRVNAVAPFAWTRLVATIPGSEPHNDERLARFKAMKPEQIAPLVVFLASDSAAEVNGQVLCVRGAEILLFSLPHPVRSLYREGGYTAQGLAETLPGAFRASFEPLLTSSEVFPYDPLL
jgi:hypothetical protein